MAMHRSRARAAITVAALAVGLAAVGAAGSAHGAGPIPVPVVPAPAPVAPAAPPTKAAVRPSPFTDYTTERPGKRVKIVAADLPAPGATRSVDNGPRVVKRPKDAWPQAPAGFKVQLYADGLSKPRLIRVAPNGDAFVVESDDGVVRVFRGLLATGKAAWSGVFAKGFNKPFGIAFYPPGPDPRWLYVANTDSVVRLPYGTGTRWRAGPRRRSSPSCRAAGGCAAAVTGRATSRSRSTASACSCRSGRGRTSTIRTRRRREASAPTCSSSRPTAAARDVYASGIRNAVGIAVHPQSGELWASVNERDELGDDLVPDYITHVEEGGFYGWPWYYIGGNQDPRHRGQAPELKDKVIVPDVLLQPHSGVAADAFYDGKQFPAEYRATSSRPSTARGTRVRTGYKVIRVPMRRTARDGRVRGSS